jgi:cell wall-associated NlpC family hydrolase/outer membrane murein-binding lipoprotein Lpp
MGKSVVRTSRIPRGAIFAVALTVAGGVAIFGARAGAAPQPTISQVQTQVNSLQAKVDRVGQQYDQVSQQLAAAQRRLAQVNRAAVGEQTRYVHARAQLAQVAVAAYENHGQTSVIGVLVSGDPSKVLAQASLLLQQAGTHQAQANEFLADAHQLAAARTQRQRTEEGIAALQTQLSTQKATLATLLGRQQAILKSLTAAQRAKVAAAAVGGTGTRTPAPAPHPVSTPTPSPSPTSTPSPSPSPTSTPTPPPSSTGTQADKAVAFAYAQLGKPYVWGATGPDSYDCSGLVQAAWSAAGVSIPRTTYEQWAALPHIASSSIQPGDLLFYEAEGHVAIYVGGGYIIDAPTTGLDVEKIPMNTGWYAANFDGAVRP